MSLTRIVDLFEECFRDAAVFQREVSGASLFETDTLRKEKKEWVVIAAGVGPGDAATFFPGNASRAERAQVPLRIASGGQLSVLFVIRPFDPGSEDLPQLPLITPFAPGRGVPYAEIRNGSFFRPSGLSGKQVVVENFRWELDVGTSQQEPMEDWLCQWKRFLGHNPAHAPSHFHFNTPPLDAGRGARGRAEHARGDLRLAVGLPNPLALILSFAGWLRSC